MLRTFKITPTTRNPTEPNDLIYTLMKVVGRGRTEEMRNKEIIVINLTVFLSVYAMWLRDM